MRNTTNNLADLTTHRGLYRVWVRADEIEGAPLVSRWIDSRVESLESQEHEQQCGKHTAREMWLDLNLETICERDGL